MEILELISTNFKIDTINEFEVVMGKFDI